MRSDARAPISDGSLRVVVLRENEPVGAWEFDKESVTVGRSKTADVRLDDPAVSRVHCVVELRPAGVFVRDNGSRNGIWVNGRRFKEALLTSRDEVVIERYRLKSYRVWGGVATTTARHAPPVRRERPSSDGGDRPTPSTEQRAIEPPPPAVPLQRRAVSGSSPRPTAVVPASAPPAWAIADTAIAPVPLDASAAEATNAQRPSPLSTSGVRRFLDDVDDEDEEEATATPAFDYADLLVRGWNSRPEEGRGVVEVVRYRGVNVLEVARVDLRGVYRVPFSGSDLVSFDERDRATVEVPDGARAQLSSGSSRRPVSGRIDLGVGDVLDLRIGEIGYLMRFVEPVEPNRAEARALATGRVAAAGAGAFGMHVLVAGTFMIADALRPKEPEWGAFARVELPEETAEPKEAEVVPTPEPAKPEPKRAPAPPQRLARRPSKAPPPAIGGADRTESRVASAGVLRGLGKLDLKIDSSSSSLAAATNLDAVRSTSGKRGGFKVSSLTGKIPGGDVALGRPGRLNGSVAIDTLSGKDLLASAKGGYGGLAKRGGGKVRGVVTQTPTASVGVQGSLDRSQIAAVVNRHIAEIRHCYEKNLINDPSLAGKVQVEWTIRPDGGVAGVKTKFSSLRGGDVAGCIGGKIRGWQFPRPKGNGYVIVNYPFLFDSVGF